MCRFNIVSVSFQHFWIVNLSSNSGLRGKSGTDSGVRGTSCTWNELRDVSVSTLCDIGGEISGELLQSLSDKTCEPSVLTTWFQNLNPNDFWSFNNLLVDWNLLNLVEMTITPGIVRKKFFQHLSNNNWKMRMCVPAIYVPFAIFMPTIWCGSAPSDVCVRARSGRVSSP